MVESRRILIIGASGFLGRYLWHRFRYLGCETQGTCYANTSSNFLKFNYADADQVENLLRKYRPEVVINAGGYISGYSEQINGIASALDNQVDGAMYLAESSLKHGVKVFLTIGSSSEYGSIDDRNISEKTRLGILTPYGQIKLDITHKLSKLNSSYMQVVVLRPFLVFGSGQRLPRLTPFIMQNIDKPSVLQKLSLGHCKDFMAVYDFVKIVELLVADKIEKTNGGFEIFNICRGLGLTIGEWVNCVRQAYKLPKLADFSVKSTHHFVGDNSKLMGLVGPFAWRDHMESLRAMANADLRDNKLL